MCGLVGVVMRGGEQVSAGLIKRMARRIIHRGPDGTGAFLDGPVGLGHVRLAILDLTPSGHQPMSSRDGQLVIAYNGEVYNFRELRSELEGLGHRFRSTGDTEVLLYAYEEWGPDFVKRLNGMFALAIYDRRLRPAKVFLARDRYGIKPLYYAQIGETLLFASEIKAFFEHPEFSVRLSHPHLLEYFTFQNIFTDGTLFKGVKLLPPGHTLSLRVGGEPSLDCYWDWAFEEPTSPSSDEEYTEELTRLFEQAVNRQLVSDVEVGSYLSGGLDSGTITAVAAKQLPFLRTFTCGFDLHSASGLEMAFDEREKAEALSYLFKTEHYEVVLKAGDMERCLPKLVYHLEDLRLGQQYPNYYVAGLASKFVKVVLAGTGGDETFAGYPWRYYRAVVNDDFDHYVEKYYRFWHRLIPNSYMPRLFRPHVWDEIKHVRTIEIFRDVLAGRAGVPHSPVEYVNRSLYLEAKTFLHGLFLLDDRLSMAHGLETRVPFLDNDLVDFAQTLPMHLKLRDLTHIVRLNENEPGHKSQKYFKKTRDGKLILRRAMERYVPASVSDQVKQGFSAPDASWFRGDSIEYVRAVVNDPKSRIYEVFEPDTVKEIVGGHLRGETNRRLFIWSLLSFEWWLRVFDPSE